MDISMDTHMDTHMDTSMDTHMDMSMDIHMEMPIKSKVSEIGPIGTFVVLITVARPCGSRRVGLSFLSRGK